MANNILDNYDLVTYNFELSISNPLGGATALLAKSGSGPWPYFIDDVKIRSIVTPNTKTGTSLAIEFDFAIKEPNGAYFLQHMQEQAKGIGVDNYLKTDFMLTLTFPASDNGRFLGNVAGPYEFRIVVINCDVAIDGSGSTYNFKCVTSNQYATSNQYGMVNEAVSIEAKDIRTFFNQLSEQLKEMKKHERSAHRSTDGGVDEYEFIFPDEVVGDGDFVPEKAQELLSSFNDATYDDESWDEVAIHITENTEIPRLMDMAITSTEDFQMKIKRSQGPDTNEHKDYDSKQFYIIVPHIEHLGYDNNRQDYIRRFTYEVKPYTKTRTKVQVQEEADEEDVTEVKKEYEYIFTGQNVDVINLDVNFNFAGVIPMTKQSGITTTRSSAVVGARGRHEEDREDLQNHVELIDEEHGASVGTPPWDIGDIINSYVVSTEDNQSDHGVASQRHQGRKLASNFWLESLVSRQENMLQIDLEIRGDPDWLNESVEETVSGDIFFTLKVKSPRPSDVEGEWIPSSNMVVLSGFYQVLEVNSNFNNGTFTQTLNAIRVPRNRLD